MNRFESRYFNTACLMDEALLDLLQTKGYPFISVKEICRKAGVNRSTFYLHYESMDDLLKETVERINREFVESFSSTDLAKKSLHGLSLEEKMFITPQYLVPLLSFMKEHKKVMRLYQIRPEVFSPEGSFRPIKEEFLTFVLNDFGVPSKNQDYYISFYMQGLFAVIYTWIDHDCDKPIQEMVDLIISLLKGTGDKRMTIDGSTKEGKLH